MRGNPFKKILPLLFAIFAGLYLLKDKSPEKAHSDTYEELEYSESEHNESEDAEDNQNLEADTQGTSSPKKMNHPKALASKVISDNEYKVVFDQSNSVPIKQKTKTLAKVTKKITYCLEKDFCGEKPTVREGGVEYFDPNSTGHHSVLSASLTQLENILEEDPELAGLLDANTLIKAAKIQHRSIPMTATTILTQHFSDQVPTQVIVRQLKNVKGPVKARSLSILTHEFGATNEIKDSIQSELREDTESSWDTLKEVSSMNLNNDEYLQLVRSACPLKHPRVRPKKAQRRFNKILQRDLNNRQINLSPSQICS